MLESKLTKKEITKRKIVDAALICFAEMGLQSTSVRDIAKEAKISLGSMYNYYKSKEELMQAILFDSFKVLDHTIPELGEQSPQKVFSDIIEQFIQLIEVKIDRLRLLTEMGVKKNKPEFIIKMTHEKYEESVMKISNVLSALKINQAEMEARLIVAMLDGLVFESLLMGDKIRLGEIKEYLIQKYCKSNSNGY